MTQRCKLMGLITPIQTELLKTLYELYGQVGPAKYWKPKELGAFRSSHHALTLRRLQERGLVERIGAGQEASKGYAYRITQLGVDTWRLLQELSAVPVHALLGGDLSKERSLAFAKVAY